MTLSYIIRNNGNTAYINLHFFSIGFISSQIILNHPGKTLKRARRQCALVNHIKACPALHHIKACPGENLLKNKENYDTLQ